MYQCILVGTDGSESAAKAVRHAAELAKLSGAALHIVHAYQPVAPLAVIGPDAGAAAMSVGINEAAERNAAEVVRLAGEQARRGGLEQVETHLCTGDAASALVDIAEAVEADLLVVGNKGMSGVRRFMLGSVPNKVSHHCSLNLLIVHTT